MKTIRIREIEIGAGMPKICVPVTGVTVSEILEQTAQAVVLFVLFVLKAPKGQKAAK